MVKKVLLILFLALQTQLHAQFLIGSAKEPIDCFLPGVGMMGYGDVDHKMETNERPIFSRAFVIQSEESGKQLAMVCSELCSISQSVKEEVMLRLNKRYPGEFEEANVWLTAQHTHSAAAGYIQYPIYSATAVGFQPKVFEAIVVSIVNAIGGAKEKMEAGNISINSDAFPDDVPVAWNRSLAAYNENPDVTHFDKHEAHLALDRNMYQLSLEGEKGNALGLLNWFGVHCTSVGKEYHDMNSDNKGWASEFFEKELGDDFVAVFAQGTSGDVSPYYHGPGEWRRRKQTQDRDQEMSRLNGEMQFKQAWDIHQGNYRELSGEIDYGLMYIDMSKIDCDPAFTGGVENARTAPGALGVAFFQGTKVDGMGMPGALAGFSKMWCGTIKMRRKMGHWFRAKEKRKALKEFYQSQGNKAMLMETGDKILLGRKKVSRVPIPQFADPAIRSLKTHYRKGSLEEHTWVQEIVPIQIVIIGDIALAAIPTEITTTAGKRLRATVEETLSKRGISQVIIAPYSNSYIGYITTHQEYRLQEYEGGHTVHGQWSLAAMQTKFRELAETMLLPENQRDYGELRPPQFSQEELSKRTELEIFPRKARKKAKESENDPSQN